MRIFLINANDEGGGAEKIVTYLQKNIVMQGYHITILVGNKKKQNDPYIYLLDNNTYLNKWTYFWDHNHNNLINEKTYYLHKLIRFLALAGQPIRFVEILVGIEDFNYPTAKALRKYLEKSPDIIHAHNLHGYYFDLRVLKAVSAKFPTLITLHDEWLYTGHCAYSIECQRWRTGCGKCPDLKRYPSIRQDATAINWKRKQTLYKNSHLYLASPSQFIASRVSDSMLTHRKMKVINNGIDLGVFNSNDRSNSRQKLGFQDDAIVFLFTARGGKGNPYKDYQTIEKAAVIIKEKNPDKNIFLISIGGNDAEKITTGNFTTVHVPYISDASLLADYYKSADIYLFATKADNYPTTIMEAMACSLRVIATEVGGIPEQIQHPVTGIIVPPGDFNAMAEQAQILIDDEARRKQIGTAAAEYASRFFDHTRMVNEYVDYYQEIIADYKSLRSPHT